MDRKTILAVMLCLLIYMGWQKFYIEPRFPQGTAPVVTQTQQNTSPVVTDSTVVSQAKSATTPQPPATRRPPQTVALRTSISDAQVGDAGAFFTDWQLKTYKLGIASDSAAVNLHSVTNEKGEISLAFDESSYAYLNDVQGNLTSTPQGAQWTYSDDNVQMSREILSSDQKPYVDMVVKAEFKTKRPRFAFISISGQGIDKDPEAQDRQLVYWTNQSLERVQLKDTIAQKEIATTVKYVGAANRYFLMTVVSQSPIEPNGLIQPAGNNEGRISLVYPVTENSITIPLRVYFGPKELDLLRQVNPALDHTVDFGWFTVFAYPLLKILKWLYQFVQNYGVAIIILTLLLKIITYPLTYKSMKSMKKMAKLQPQLQKIREKYADDKEALNREMLTMMRSNGYNPMAGCLPMLIQMPIFFALYRVLYSSIELYHAPFALWIMDLSSRDPYYVTPVLLSLTMFVQQKLTPNTATDPAQARMMQFMPLIFGAFMIALPSGLTIYMLVNALASIVQQMILNKKFDAAPAR
jgi:YidC/Oxa1 family membrane protein insertase